MRVAAIDIGTNTILLLVAEVESDHRKGTTVLHDEARVIRLGQDVAATQRFHPDALARAEACLADYAAVIARFKPDRVLACATSAARDVSNGHELSAICARHNIALEVISGAREAELTFRGTVRPAQNDPVLVVDVGGGSTEFIYGANQTIQARQSLDIGAVRLTEMLVTGHPVAAPEMAALRNYVDQQLNSLLLASSNQSKQIFPKSMASLTAVAGTPTTLAALDLGETFNADHVEGYKFSAQRLGEWVDRLAKLSVAGRQSLIGMEPKRADVIVAGAVILERAMRAFESAEMVVSARGLRYGIAYELASD